MTIGRRVEVEERLNWDRGLENDQGRGRKLVLGERREWVDVRITEGELTGRPW